MKHDLGRIYAEYALFPNVSTLYVSNVYGYNYTYKVMQDFINQGCNLIVATRFITCLKTALIFSLAHNEPLLALASAYPAVFFLQVCLPLSLFSQP